MAARSSNRRRDTASRVAGAAVNVTFANGREKSVAASNSTATPSPAASTTTTCSPTGSSNSPAASAPST